MVANKVELPWGGGAAVVVFMSGRTKTHSLGFCQWQTWLQAVGRADRPVVHNSRPVMQPAADFAVGGLHPVGRVDRQ